MGFLIVAIWNRVRRFAWRRDSIATVQTAVSWPSVWSPPFGFCCFKWPLVWWRVLKYFRFHILPYVCPPVRLSVCMSLVVSLSNVRKYYFYNVIVFRPLFDIPLSRLPQFRSRMTSKPSVFGAVYVQQCCCEIGMFRISDLSRCGFWCFDVLGHWPSRWSERGHEEDPLLFHLSALLLGYNLIIRLYSLIGSFFVYCCIYFVFPNILFVQQKTHSWRRFYVQIESFLVLKVMLTVITFVSTIEMFCKFNILFYGNVNINQLHAKICKLLERKRKDFQVYISSGISQVVVALLLLATKRSLYASNLNLCHLNQTHDLYVYDRLIEQTFHCHVIILLTDTYSFTIINGIVTFLQMLPLRKMCVPWKTPGL